MEKDHNNKKDEDSLNVFRETFKKQIGKKTSFNKYMEKMKMILKNTLKKEKKISTGRKGNKIIQAAEWMDTEIIESLKARSKANRNWRYARKNRLAKEIQEEFKEEYLKLKKKTALMVGEKKSD